MICFINHKHKQKEHNMNKPATFAFTAMCVCASCAVQAKSTKIIDGCYFCGMD